MEKCLKELRDLHDEYNEKEVREKLAIGLVNAIRAWSNSGKEYYQYLLLLYLLRYSLPNDEKKQQNVELTEILTVKETARKIENEYKKSKKRLKIFLQKVTKTLGDETEVLLLMNAVSEDLSLEVREAVWHLL